jgi:HlyD family secretion protein
VTGAGGWTALVIQERHGRTMNASARPRLKKWQITLLLAAVVIAGLAAYSGRGKSIDVQVVSPAYKDLESTVGTGGMVVPLEEFPARANFAGIVTDIHVQLGQKVRPGQLLITMKDQYALARLETAKSAYEAAKMSERYAENNGSPEDRIGFEADRRKAVEEQQKAAAALSTLKELRQRGSVSDAEVAAGEQRLQAACENLQALEERDKKRYTPGDLQALKVKLAAAKASMAAEKVSYDNAYITSPINGTVFSIPVSRYDFVPMGGDLLRVADMTKIQVHADFDEPDISKLHSGQPVKINWDGRPYRTWHGHVVHAPMAVTAENARNIGQCTIAVDDADGDLPADSHVTVMVTIDTHRHVLVIPREALHTEGTGRFVYRVVDGKLEKTAVTVGLASLLEAEITGGLTPRDVIVTRAPHGGNLENHVRAEIVK